MTTGQRVTSGRLWLAAAVLMFAPMAALAQSSKATAAINTAVGCTVKGTSDIGDTLPVTCHDVFNGNSVPVTADNFAAIMTTSLHASNSQSFFVSPSLVTGLYTQTKTKGNPGNGTSTAVAAGGVYLRAVIQNTATDEIQVGYPVAMCTPDILGCYADKEGSKGVTLDSRVQTLSQDISECIVNDLSGSQIGTCTFDLTTNLILQTTSAHTFNFIFPKVGQGDYIVQIQAAVNANAAATGGTAVGAAAYGLGSVTVESVRLVHGFSF